MKLSIKEIGLLLEGVIEGNEEIVITRPEKIEDATKGSITFLANKKYEDFIYKTKASAVLVDKSFSPKKKIEPALIRVENVYASIGRLLQLFGQISPDKGISSTAFIHPSTQIGKEVFIGDFTFIDANVLIGDNCQLYPQVFIGRDVQIGHHVTIYPGAKIYPNCQIGNHCIIQANAVIGSDGFGFALQANKSYQKIPQVGNVILEEQVEVGANTVIDRATMGSTIIRKGTKLDNLIQIAHNVEIGPNTVIAAQAGVAGSTKIGAGCQIGGQAGFVGHIEVANGVKVQAQSGVAASIKKEGSAVYGYPALSYRTYLKAYSLFRQLPELEKRIRQLEQQD